MSSPSLTLRAPLRLATPLLALVLLASATAAAAEDPWEALRAIRQDLVADSPLAADFEQTYVPAGFSSGERENGQLMLGLPSCLRWDYEEPYPRRYLLCEQTVWAWSPDEPVGDRLLDVSRDEAGLDFLLLSVDRLSERYTVESTSADDALVRLTLTPHSPTAPFEQAWITLDPAAGRPTEIAYRDREGNETRFVLSRFRPLEDEALLSPPDGIDWIDG